MPDVEKNITIIADFRENASGIPQLLLESGIKTIVQVLKRGDYLLNGEIIIERKTKEDFVLSLMQNRLFKQCANLKKTNYHQILLIEGNPYKTKHDISRQAVRGALLSVSLSWQIPIVFSADKFETAEMLILAAKQNLQEKFMFQRTGYKPKTITKKQLYFLQGLPSVGPKIATELLKQFGTIEKIISATEKQLREVPGIGKDKAEKIRKFIVSKVLG
ncbi:MAG: ERCC4 domain-containing protein [Bacteroidota bacterium]